MAPGTYHGSHYEKGSYKEGEWHCDHGEQVVLLPSRRDNEHKGKQCMFVLAPIFTQAC